MSGPQGNAFSWIRSRLGAPILFWFIAFAIVGIAGGTDPKAAADFALSGTVFLLLYMAVRSTARFLSGLARSARAVDAQPASQQARAPHPVMPRANQYREQAWGSATRADQARPDVLRERAANDPRWFEAEEGDSATFEYVDSDGVVTSRDVRNWKSSGAYIRAYCLQRRESRTFRKDRISNWRA